MKTNTYKRVITKAERLQIEGLMALAHQAIKQMEACDKAMTKILNYKSSYGGSYVDYLSDAYFESDYDVEDILKSMGIKIK